MAVKIGIDADDIQGYLSDVLIRRLPGVPEICRNYLKQGMEMAEGLAQIYVPVDKGILRDSIHLEESNGGFSLVANAVNSQGEEYAKFPEFGTSKQIPQPFIRPAVDEAVEYITEGVSNAIANLFTKDYYLRGGRMYEVIREKSTGKIRGGGYV